MMGANSTQAQAVTLFLSAFVFIAAGLAADIGYLWLLIGIALLGVSCALFLKCKPWEQKEE
ncbi:MAG TPA: hypothetical protein VG345_06710 [Bryobacteraceae bacterium]|jgi:hypothetical protein|nr:hypothetical protein [Bryobacteraceae bacterium]